MKRNKRLGLLVGALVMTAITALGVLHYQERQEDIQNTDEVILQIDESAVTALSWTYGNTSLAFHKDDDTWVYDEDDAFPVDPEQIDVLLSYFTELGAAFIIESPEDLGQYGLDDPECSITVTSGNETQTILLGDYSSMDSQRYVSIGDGNVYLVASDPLSAYEVDVIALIDNDDLPSFDKVESITFEGSDSYDIVYQAYSEDSTATYNSDDVYFKKEDDTLSPLDTDKVTQYLSALSGMSQETVVTYNAGDDDLATYGLDDPELSATIDYTDETTDDNGETSEISGTFSFALSRDAATKAADAEKDGSTDDSEDSDDEEKRKAYVRIGDSRIVYEISESSYDALMAYTYDDLRHAANYSGSFDQITGLDVTIDGKTAEITSEENDDTRTFSYNDEEIDTSTIQTALEAVTATSFTGEVADGEEELALTLHLDNDAFSTVKLVFYRHDGDTCLVTVDGEPTAYVDRSAVVDLIEAFNTIIL